ncbi:hypothetical protein WUBG_17359, partial [Wuchereria bancrofti]
IVLQILNVSSFFSLPLLFFFSKINEKFLNINLISVIICHRWCDTSYWCSIIVDNYHNMDFAMLYQTRHQCKNPGDEFVNFHSYYSLLALYASFVLEYAYLVMNI